MLCSASVAELNMIGVGVYKCIFPCVFVSVGRPVR